MVTETYEPLPAVPLSVQSLRYAAKPRQPAVLTTIGLLSIVFGVFGLAWSAIDIRNVIDNAEPFESSQVTYATPSPYTPIPSPMPANWTPVTIYPTATVEWQIRRSVVWLVIGDGVVDAAMDVLLIVLGGILLRGLPTARPSHLIWAWAKLPAAVLTFATTLWWQEALSGHGWGAIILSGAPSRQGLEATTVVRLADAAAISVPYAIVVLIVMRLKHVREYYDAGARAAVR
jgi:hypothetical protein